MVAAADLRLVLVTPETTLLDERVRKLQFPLYDGQMGVLPGRAPLVGRLGVGALTFETSGGTSNRYFVDGGFVQIKGSVVTLLTNRAMPVEKIDLSAAEAELAAAISQTPTTNEGLDAKHQAVERARRMISLRR